MGTTAAIEDVPSSPERPNVPSSPERPNVPSSPERPSSPEHQERFNDATASRPETESTENRVSHQDLVLNRPVLALDGSGVERQTGFCSHWSSYQSSIGKTWRELTSSCKTWRELKVRPCRSIKWMFSVFTGKNADPKADFVFCLNAMFILSCFVGGAAVLFSFFVFFQGHSTWFLMWQTPIAMLNLQYAHHYMFYSTVVMSKNACVVCGAKWILFILMCSALIFLMPPRIWLEGFYYYFCVALSALMHAGGLFGFLVDLWLFYLMLFLCARQIHKNLISGISTTIDEQASSARNGLEPMQEMA